MRQQAGETLVGALVALVAAGFLWYAVARAGAGESVRGGYALLARFDRVAGISVGSDVRMSGVKIGAVRSVDLDPETYQARLTLDLSPDIKVPEDSTARITSDSLLGGSYVGIEPGGAEEVLAEGGEIANTQPSIDLLTLFSSVASSQSPPSSQNVESGSTPEGYPQ